MKHQFLRVMETFRNVNISQTPNYRTMLAIALHPKATFPKPAIVAASMKIEVNDTFINDPELFQPTVDAYVETLNRIYDQMLKDLSVTGYVENAFMVMAAQMSLTYTA